MTRVTQILAKLMGFRARRVIHAHPTKWWDEHPGVLFPAQPDGMEGRISFAVAPVRLDEVSRLFHPTSEFLPIPS